MWKTNHVRNDIAIKVGGNTDVEKSKRNEKSQIGRSQTTLSKQKLPNSLGLPEHPVDHRVYDLLLKLHPGVLLTTLALLDSPNSLSEQAIGDAQHVALMHDSDLGLPFPPHVLTRRPSSLPLLPSSKSNFKRHSTNPAGRSGANLPRGEGNSVFAFTRNLFLLDVKAFGVFPYNDQVHGLCRRLTRDGNGGDGADVGIEVEVLTKGHDGRRVASDLVRWRGHGTKHCTVTLPQSTVESHTGNENKKGWDPRERNEKRT